MTKQFYTLLIGIKIVSILTISGLLGDTFSPIPDEVLIAEVAYNVNQGRGFVTSIDPKSKIPSELYVSTAMRPTYPVLLHVFFQKIYFENLPGSFRNVVDSRYFFFYSVFLSLLNLIFSALGLFSFYSISKSVLGSEFWACIACLALCLYPSVLNFIGSKPFYESLALYLLIILVNLFQKPFIHQFPKIGFTGSLLLVIACIGPLVRPQLFLLYGIIAALALFLSFAKENKSQRFYFSYMGFGTILVLFILNLPILIKNKLTVGHITLSTAAAFDLLDGHNPFARGSWCGECGKENHPFYSWVRGKIKNYDQLNEWNRSTSRAGLAIEWVLNNPYKELILVARKIAIFFLPYNYENLKFNLFNALAHLGFIGFIVSKAAKFKSMKSEFLWPAIVVIGSILLSQIWFVGFRWRYYAEPFMLILALSFWLSILKYFFPTIFDNSKLKRLFKRFDLLP